METNDSNTDAPQVAEAPKKRGRPPRAKPNIPVPETPVVAAPAIPAAETDSLRRDMRGEARPILREEDPRVRAARRAEEIRNHLGTMDEGTDEFYIDPRDIPPGWSYEWKRKVVMGKEDPAYQVHLARMGWEPVPASRHPSYMPEGTSVATIERKGMILMERPSELSEEARAIEQRRARNQVKQKESQLNSAPEGTMQRTRSDGTALTSIKKSYEAIPVPND